MKTEITASYTIEADETVLGRLHHTDVMDALCLAARDECCWEVLDIAGTSCAYFEDRRGQPFEIRYEPARVPIKCGDGCSRSFKARRKRRLGGITTQCFGPTIRRRASTKLSHNVPETSATSDLPSG